MVEAVEKQSEAESDGEGNYEAERGEERGRHGRLGEVDDGGFTLHVACLFGEVIAYVAEHYDYTIKSNRADHADKASSYPKTIGPRLPFQP